MSEQRKPLLHQAFLLFCLSLDLQIRLLFLLYVKTGPHWIGSDVSWMEKKLFLPNDHSELVLNE
ncbi:hypothetical protein AR543_p0170 (plasmid) [Paenibacillus bovis]|uniref:Uncharacterized protein n=1 Tax=Paenibacillus bovis TaxID=1616788 RepID=A0A1X9T4B7_9BACL|nr:hypothetical protein AR543_p0170 [Paenibacillus bovis]